MDDPQDLRHRKGVFGTTKWRVTGLPILIKEGADEKIRGRQQFFLYEKQGDNHPTKAAIPVQKWINLKRKMNSSPNFHN